MLDIMEGIQDNEDICNTKDIVVIITQTNVLYSNTFMLTANSLNKRMILLQNYKSLDKFSQNSFEKLFNSAKKHDEIVLIEGEKYVTDEDSLIGLCIKYGIKANQLANISIQTMTTLDNIEKTTKSPSYQYNGAPEIEYANELIRKYLRKREKYRLNALLLYNLVKARMLYNYNIAEVHREIFDSMVSNIKLQQYSILANLIKEGLDHTELYKSIEQQADLPDLDINEIDLNSLSDEIQQSLKSMFKQRAKLKLISSINVSVRYSTESKNSVYALDNITLYKNVLEQIINKYYMVQLETLYAKRGMTVDESLKQMGLERKDLVVTEKLYEERNAHISELLNTIYKKMNSYDSSLTRVESSKYINELYNVICELNNHDMVVALVDAMNIWILVPRSIALTESLGIINNAIKNTYIDKALLREHICVNKERRRQFIEYNDKYTIKR